MNRKLKDKKVSIGFKEPWKIPYEFNKRRQKEKEKTKQKTATESPKFEENPAWRCLLNEVRTYFKKNPNTKF